MNAGARSPTHHNSETRRLETEALQKKNDLSTVDTRARAATPPHHRATNQSSRRARSVMARVAFRRMHLAAEDAVRKPGADQQAS